MKKLFSVLFILGISALLTNVFGQREQTSTIKNASLDACNSKLSFEIWSRSTGATTTIPVGVSSFLISINSASLNNPILSNVNSKFSTSNGQNNFSLQGVDYNQMGVQITSGKVNVTIYYTGDAFGFETLSTASPDGERICTVTLDITNHASTSDLIWDEINSSITLTNGAALANETWIGSESDLNLGLKLWTGTTSTDWSTSTNWCPTGAPTSTDSVVIQNVSNKPELSASSSTGPLVIVSSSSLSLNGNLLTINEGAVINGSLIGSSTSSLSFAGTTSSTLRMDTTQWDTTNLLQNLTVNLTGGASLTLGSKVGVIGLLTPTAGTITTAGNLRICSSSPTTYGQIHATATGTISGSMTVQTTFTNGTAGWRHIGLPVIGTINDIDSFNILDSNHTVPAEKNIKYWNAVPVSGNNAPGWTVPDSTFGATVGYAVYGSSTSGSLLYFNKTWSATGTISTGQRDFVIKNSVAGNSSDPDDQGWNLIANPYPSNLDVSTLWNTTLNNSTYKAIHIWDQLNSQYKAITSNGVTIITNGGANGTAISSSVIPPFQAFWVKASADETISFNNSNRTNSATGLGTFMKKEYDLARVDVYTADSTWDQTVIYFDENGNAGLDNGMDALKMFSENPFAPGLYSVGPEGNFSINALNSNNHIHSVPLGFRSTKTGQMSFSLNTSELDAKWFVYLEDKELGIFYNIKDKPYTFNHTQNSDSRFVLHFQTYGLSAEKLVDDIQNMSIGGDGTAVYVFVPAFYKDQNYQLEVIDMAGRVVYTDNKLAMTPGMNTLNLNLNANAYYAVRIKAAEGIASGKVQIR